MSKRDGQRHGDPDIDEVLDKAVGKLREMRGIPADKDSSANSQAKEKDNKKPFLGGHPIGESEFMVLVHFFWLTSFFILFLFVRMLVLISGV